MPQMQRFSSSLSASSCPVSYLDEEVAVRKLVLSLQSPFSPACTADEARALLEASAVESCGAHWSGPDVLLPDVPLPLLVLLLLVLLLLVLLSDTSTGASVMLPLNSGANVLRRATGMATETTLGKKRSRMVGTVDTWPWIHNMVVVTSPIGVQAPPEQEAMGGKML